MDTDLNLESSAYNWALTMFFIGYIVYVINSSM
jgi:cbb3-type cytochrome oxidase subunit 3